jgi:hypothetical protein
MKKILFIILLFPLVSISQQKVDVDKVEGVGVNQFYTVGGEPFSTTKYTKIVAGTPYFKKDWMEAILIPVTSTKKYKVEKARLDLLTNEVYFIDNDGVEKTALVNFTNPANANKGNWYQLVVPGNVSLYKLNKKVIYESTPYGSSLTEQKIKDSEEYYLLMNDKLTAVKSVLDLQQLLPEKKQEMKTFIDSLKKEKNKSDAFIQTVTYYNTLIN